MRSREHQQNRCLRGCSTSGREPRSGRSRYQLARHALEVRGRWLRHCRQHQPRSLCAGSCSEQLSQSHHQDCRQSHRGSGSRCACADEIHQCQQSDRCPRSWSLPKAVLHPCRHNHRSGSKSRLVSRQTSCLQLRQRFRRCPAKCPGFRYRSKSQQSSAHT